MGISVSMGGGGMVGGGGMGAGIGMTEPTLWNKIMEFMGTLPPWLSTIIMAAAVILIAMFVGMIVGQIIGRVIYPNPDKPSVLNKKEKMIFSGVLAVAVVLVVVMVMPKSEKPDDLEVGGSGIDGSISDSIGGDMDGGIGGDMGDGITDKENSLIDGISPEGDDSSSGGDEATGDPADSSSGTSGGSNSSSGTTDGSSSSSTPPVTKENPSIGGSGAAKPVPVPMPATPGLG